MQDTKESNETQAEKTKTNPKPPGKKRGGSVRPCDLTDVANARRLAARHGDDLRYCYAWRKWLVWDGTRWAIDDGAEIERLAKDTVRSIYREAAAEPDDSARRIALAGWARTSESVARIKATIELARSEDGIPVDPAEMDTHPWLLNCPNGTLDLRTGTLRKHDRRDMLTKLCPTIYDPAAQCPHWKAMFEKIFAGNAALIAYKRRLLGYCLTGSVREHILPIAYGTGDNAKSTEIEAMIGMMGSDYAMQAPSDLLLAKGDTHPTERADLHGKRLVAVIETDEGRRLDEALVKQLTGSDRIRARRMREDFWEFSPTHKLILATNHKPIIRGTDHAIWRRMKLIPFTVKIPEAEKDKDYPEKLRGEYPGILRWCLSGCLEWQQLGMREPPEVIAATAGYRDEQDVLGQWIAERCVIGDGYRAKSSDLYADYVEWADAAKEHVAKQRAVGTALTERGFALEKGTGGARFRSGIGLLAKSE